MLLAGSGWVQTITCRLLEKLYAVDDLLPLRLGGRAGMGERSFAECSGLHAGPALSFALPI